MVLAALLLDHSSPPPMFSSDPTERDLNMSPKRPCPRDVCPKGLADATRAQLPAGTLTSGCVTDSNRMHDSVSEQWEQCNIKLSTHQQSLCMIFYLFLQKQQIAYSYIPVWVHLGTGRVF